MTDLTDLGIHRTKEDQQELELKQAGWKPGAAHPRSPTWLSPDDGKWYPGPGYAWSLIRHSSVCRPVSRQKGRRSKNMKRLVKV